MQSYGMKNLKVLKTENKFYAEADFGPEAEGEKLRAEKKFSDFTGGQMSVRGLWLLHMH